MRAGRSPISSSTSTATGAGDRTTTPSTPSSNIAAAASLLTFAYTWAKSTDTKSAAAGIGATGFNGWQGFLNNHDPERDHGLSDFDVDHRLVGSFVYNLPFGNGERFAGDATGVKNAIVGGWQVNGIYTWQHGFPITIQAADLGGLNDTFGANRADLVGDPDSGSTTASSSWFNTAAFAQPGLGQLGDSGRNILRGPGINNLDFSVFKNFDFGHWPAPAIPVGVVQFPQPPAVQRRRHEHRESDLRGGHIRTSRSDQSAGVEVPVLTAATVV